MDYYLDIRVEADLELELSAPTLLNSLFAKFHVAMAQTCPGEILISFPEYGTLLGTVLRLHGTEEALEKLMMQPWLKSVRDYITRSEIRQIPKEIKGYRTFYRIQKKSLHNIRNRAMIKHGLSADEAIEKYPEDRQTRLEQPFLQIPSLSTKQTMRIYIAQGELQQSASSGAISSYGLSKEATIPWF